jgi:hypothetical protein
MRTPGVARQLVNFLAWPKKVTQASGFSETDLQAMSKLKAARGAVLAGCG